MGGANAGVFVNLTEHDIVDFGDLLAVDLDTAPLPEDHDLGDGDEDDTSDEPFHETPPEWFRTTAPLRMLPVFIVMPQESPYRMFRG